MGNGLELECTMTAFIVYYNTQFFSDQYSELPILCLSSSFDLHVSRSFDSSLTID
jgi:hypothetical protein